MLSQCVYIWYVSGEIHGCMVNLTFQCMLILLLFLTVDLCKKHSGKNVSFQLLPIIIQKCICVNTNGMEIYYMFMPKASLSIKQFSRIILTLPIMLNS